MGSIPMLRSMLSWTGRNPRGQNGNMTFSRMTFSILTQLEH
jgi:hypothetical protein